MAILKGTLLIALAACSAFAADSGLLSLVSPDAKVVAGIHVDRSTASQFGQFLLKQMQREDADFNKFVLATGFDPRRDLTEVIVSSSDVQQKGHGLVVARGTFDIAKLTAQAKLSGDCRQIRWMDWVSGQPHRGGGRSRSSANCH